ncbi:MAG: hypothetical protein ACR2QE_21240 [Acidimicrobiales bacterium]
MDESDEKLVDAFGRLYDRRRQSTDVSAALLDVLDRAPRWRRWEFPSGLFITGAAVATLLLAILGADQAIEATEIEPQSAVPPIPVPTSWPEIPTETTPLEFDDGSAEVSDTIGPDPRSSDEAPEPIEPSGPPPLDVAPEVLPTTIPPVPLESLPAVEVVETRVLVQPERRALPATAGAVEHAIVIDRGDGTYLIESPALKGTCVGPSVHATFDGQTVELGVAPPPACDGAVRRFTIHVIVRSGDPTALLIDGQRWRLVSPTALPSNCARPGCGELSLWLPAPDSRTVAERPGGEHASSQRGPTGIRRQDGSSRGDRSG